jgi:biopolymer transport protein ExbB/TolQ
VSLTVLNLNPLPVPGPKRSGELAGLFGSIGTLAQGLFILLLFMGAWWRLFIPVERYVEAVFLLLFLMAACLISVVVERSFRYWTARDQSRTFARQVAGAWRDYNLAEAMEIAGRYHRSPMARVAASGLGSFLAAMPLLSDAEAIEVAQQAMRRSANAVHGEIRRGLRILASIAATAPLVGAFGTVVGITYSFRGAGIAKSALMAMVSKEIAEALLPTAFALFVAVLTLWCYKYLSSESEAFDIEVKNESLDLVNYLIVCLGRRK